jgi:DNA repair protein RecN (Recombination protein N)
MESTSFKVEFKVEFKRQNLGAAKGPDLVSKITPRGIDSVEFLVVTNKGEAPRPLTRVASGGELSRLILALKTIIAADDPEKTLVFDEVDSGIGGRVAEVVGRKLKQVSRNNQVLCITHLPQIASFADEHYQVYKQVRGGRAETLIERLDAQHRVEEIARMLGGEKITETATKHAREMLQLAENIKASS